MNDFLRRIQGHPPIPAEERDIQRGPNYVRTVRTPPELSPRIDTREIDIVKRGEAIAHVRALEEKVAQLETLNGKLEASMARCDERCYVLDDERRRYRAQAEKYRALLLELSSDMRSISLLTERAESTHERIMAIIEVESDPSQRRESPADPLERATEAIHSALGKAPSFADSSVEALQPGASDEPSERSVPPTT